MFTLKHYTRRDDLCAEGQTALYHLKDYGSIIRITGKGWFCTNDVRRYLVGVAPNDQLCQPTLGPFKTAKAACEAREAAKKP